MDNSNIREALLEIRSKIDGILAQDAPEQKDENRRSPVAECQELFLTILSQAAQKKPAHEVGGQITLHNADYGDILMDCIHPIDGGKRGLYLFHHGQDYGNNDYQLSNVREPERRRARAGRAHRRRLRRRRGRLRAATRAWRPLV